MKNTIEIINGIPRQEEHIFCKPINLTIAPKEQVAIIGNNGVGKRVLTEIILGSQPLKGEGVHYNFPNSKSLWVSDNIKHIAFKDSYGIADKEYYHQQRWNSMDRDGQQVVRDVLNQNLDSELKTTLFELFNIDSMLDKELILLSSGELRKLQLTKSLLKYPQMLILENPFIGLDAQTRAQLQELLGQITHKTDLQIILVLSKSDELPSFISHVVPVVKGAEITKISREEYLKTRPEDPKRVLSDQLRQRILDLPIKESSAEETDSIVTLNNVSIKYEQHTILKDLSWTMKRGEQWSISGQNGSGKSTLLSLICADNPQGYACDITLFGLRRGVNASIWDIKSHIGYVSPEMHRSYSASIPCIEIVASGLHDTVGLYKKMRPEDREICEFWMEVFGIRDLADRNFMRISSGEQRLVLLARAFVKDPQLLILDEPLHGLDMHNRRLAIDVIEAFCSREKRSLIFVTHYLEELPTTITHHLQLKSHKE